MRRRIFAGDSVMVMDEGFDDGLPTANASPAETCTGTAARLGNGRPGGAYCRDRAAAPETPPDMPGPQENCYNCIRDWSASTDREERAHIWDTMLGIQAEELYTIGIVSAVPQPVVVSKPLAATFPKKGVYSWQPGAQFRHVQARSFSGSDRQTRQRRVRKTAAGTRPARSAPLPDGGRPTMLRYNRLSYPHHDPDVAGDQHDRFRDHEAAGR